VSGSTPLNTFSILGGSAGRSLSSSNDSAGAGKNAVGNDEPGEEEEEDVDVDVRFAGTELLDTKRSYPIASVEEYDVPLKAFKAEIVVVVLVVTAAAAAAAVNEVVVKAPTDGIIIMIGCNANDSPNDDSAAASMHVILAIVVCSMD
jgi:hypothetical protein